MSTLSGVVPFALAGALCVCCVCVCVCVCVHQVCTDCVLCSIAGGRSRAGGRGRVKTAQNIAVAVRVAE